jgi:GAF domain-containing protein
VFHDISARKQAEARLLQLNRTLRLLSDCDSALVHSPDEQTLIHQVCEILTGHGGYRLAWVGFTEDPPESTFRPMIWTGPAAGYISTVDWNAPELAQSPAMRALHSGQPVALHDFASEPLFKPWLELAESFGIASCIALPLKTQDRPFGVLALHASRAHAFDAEEIVLLSELADDLAFGITVLRTRAERDHAVEARERSMRRAQKSLEDAIQDIAYTVELRDAYTAGHQRRSTDLAVRIAEEVGLSQERIRGIRLACAVHDIGNIQVPASILSKPARLTALEYRLVQTHCQAGFEILKGIEFPWPIAEVVLQHQERLDGSGYPRGLTASQILVEARIIAVADVVAAMASHRPYRRALGVDAALAEILRGRGTRYDAAAVDACTRLFRDKGYKLLS